MECQQPATHVLAIHHLKLRIDAVVLGGLLTNSHSRSSSMASLMWVTPVLATSAEGLRRMPTSSSGERHAMTAIAGSGRTVVARATPVLCP